ncbi:urease accessory protein UreE [Massilia sp. LjRoot122]|uniref:urease accessory protein UreE n=1 Tax=Massilia sp. LjRoot122 TaxID=3342257 RepID=UPI003ECCB1A0
MLTLTDRIHHATRVHGVLALPWERRAGARLQAVMASGEAVALNMSCGTPLQHGDLLRGEDGRVVRIVAAPEPTYALRCRDAPTLARCARYLEQCRIQAQVCQWGLRIRAVPALRPVIRGLGVSVDDELAPFAPDTAR